MDLLRELIRTPSISRDHDGQRRVQESCLDALPGLEVQRSTDGLPWALVSTTPAPAVLFVCHTDTVPVSGDWSRDPFSGELIDGRLIHGRGSVDMKGGLAVAVNAVAFAAREGLSAGLLMTSDEEIGALGATQAAAELSLAQPPALVVVPEATDNKFSRGHRGVAWFRIHAHGRSAHASTPSEGVNAISLLSEHVISRLETLPTNTDPYLGTDTVNLGAINGGQAPNMVPDHAELTLDLRTVAGTAGIQEWLDGLPGEFSVDQLVELAPLRTDAVPPIMAEFEDLGPLPYCTDGSVLTPLIGDAPVVIWGPGGGGQMHTVDEVLSVASYEQAVANFRRVVAELG